MKKMILLVALLLTGCCMIFPNRVSVYPDKLPVAVAGKKYFAVIYIDGLPLTGMAIKIGEGYPDVYISNGLKIARDKDDRKGRVIISGVPENTGETTFSVSGGTYGTQCPGAEFAKEYTLKVISDTKTVR